MKAVSEISGSQGGEYENDSLLDDVSEVQGDPMVQYSRS
jgi:hypothetical protein